MSYKILWVHTSNYSGSCDPYEGVAIKVSNPDEKFLFLQDGEDYNLLQITDEVYNELESERRIFCDKVNRPVFHDDPYRFKAANMSNVMTFPQKSEDDDSLEGISAQPRCMTTVVIHKNVFYPDVVGVNVGKIALKDFINVKPNNNIII